jgi:hypothetical protein
MQSVDSSARRARCQHRQELRTLTYVTLDAGNGGIVRNVNSRGVAVQAVAALREKQRVRLRFELQFPRLRLDVFGEVSWANASGQCGIRFVDLPAQTRLEIDRWIFSNLLEAMTLAALDPESAFAGGFGGDRDIPHEAATNRGKEIFKNVLAENGAMEGQGRETLVRRLQEGEMISDEERGWFSRPMAAPTLGFVADGFGFRLVDFCLDVFDDYGGLAALALDFGGIFGGGGICGRDVLVCMQSVCGKQLGSKAGAGGEGVRGKNSNAGAKPKSTSTA